MPLYQIHCWECDAEDSVWRTVAERNTLPSCCGAPMARIIVAPAVRADITPYVSPATGKVVNSRRQQTYDLESSGNILNEPGLKADVVRNRAYADEKKFAPIAAGVDAAVTKLVNEGAINV